MTDVHVASLHCVFLQSEPVFHPYAKFVCHFVKGGFPRILLFLTCKIIHLFKYALSFIYEKINISSLDIV